MRTRLFAFAFAVWMGAVGVSAFAYQNHDHPTVRAAGHYADRKVAHVSNATHHVKAHYKHWKQRKGHNVRAWLNKH
jgi:hypothetical protein